MSDLQTQALADVVAERNRQDDQWGEQRHSDVIWHAILSEEVGEVANAILDALFPTSDHVALAALREEIVQVAGVAVAWIEEIDRRPEGQVELW